MITFGLLIIILSVSLIISSSRRSRRDELRDYVWSRCSAQSISLAYQAQLCFDRNAWTVAHVCFSPEHKTFWVEHFPQEPDVWSMELRPSNSFEKNCVCVERFVNAVIEHAHELEQES